MILLEFRFHRNFQSASQVLERAFVRFRSEFCPEELGYSSIFFFEEELGSEQQRSALNQARALEAEDKQESLSTRSLPILGFPF